MAYQLIAVDMDGTLLNSKKEITPRTEAAVTAALARGYHVVMTTGRCYRQIVPYMAQFPAMRYAITSSGAAVADCAQDRIISAQNLPADVAAELVRAFEGLDGFPIIFSNGEALYRPELLDDPQRFGMDAYVDNFKSHCTACEDDGAALSRCALSGGEAGLLFRRFRRARQVSRACAGCARLGRPVRERGCGGQRHRRR
ncbi:MAG: HAD family hydrolase [Oscillospiraceae bacterium]